MEHQFCEVKAVHETFDSAEVNQLLAAGWILDARFHNERKTRYVLIRF
ncbi:hypothetical protein M5X00_32050 [Paenibacillus alvei]|uniref:Uncharacterized protein n=1 Tax=Paenibacillus alvei TaxID=44250 RepID=A0ABT4GWW3_PAEAL|nr:hypothetical protein [Paenibacillus alvei]MCY9541814.1 hypothetical protein [Paenibacillus alvei]MCY9704998.1 hypothetical protein [Paenibacillus alvei]MCY9734675.1 hypothetical protein [Paenibacillus alvei]MCY9758851.1 hypothetical protein [Paenibacillus alvei]MCY9761200.1 hypothetical protein [Paenibacillus alvei]